LNDNELTGRQSGGFMSVFGEKSICDCTNQAIPRIPDEWSYHSKVN
jgi:hypothetical protein